MCAWNIQHEKQGALTVCNQSALHSPSIFCWTNEVTMMRGAEESNKRVLAWPPACFTKSLLIAYTQTCIDASKLCWSSTRHFIECTWADLKLGGLLNVFSFKCTELNFSDFFGSWGFLHDELSFAHSPSLTLKFFMCPPRKITVF